MIVDITIFRRPFVFSESYVLISTSLTLTWTITLNRLLILLGSNRSQYYYYAAVKTFICYIQLQYGLLQTTHSRNANSYLRPTIIIIIVIMIIIIIIIIISIK